MHKSVGSSNLLSGRIRCRLCLLFARIATTNAPATKAVVTSDESPDIAMLLIGN